MSPNILIIGECNVHKVHNAFSTGLSAFGSDEELFVMNMYYYFSSLLFGLQDLRRRRELGMLGQVILRLVNN